MMMVFCCIVMETKIPLECTAFLWKARRLWNRQYLHILRIEFLSSIDMIMPPAKFSRSKTSCKKLRMQSSEVGFPPGVRTISVWNNYSNARDEEEADNPGLDTAGDRSEEASRYKSEMMEGRMRERKREDVSELLEFEDVDY